jgi:hypothetical protein
MGAAGALHLRDHRSACTGDQSRCLSLRDGLGDFDRPAFYPAGDERWKDLQDDRRLEIPVH